MLPILKVEDTEVAARRAIVVYLSRARDGLPVARLVGAPARVPSNWLTVEPDRGYDVPAVLEKADRYARFEGQDAIFIYDADRVWQEAWGALH